MLLPTTMWCSHHHHYSSSRSAGSVGEKFKKPRQRNILKEFSLAPSICNTKARRLHIAHCLHWMKLSYHEVYEVHFQALMAISDDAVENNSVVVVLNFWSSATVLSTAAIAVAASTVVVAASMEEEEEGAFMVDCSLLFSLLVTVCCYCCACVSFAVCLVLFSLLLSKILIAEFYSK